MKTRIIAILSTLMLALGLGLVSANAAAAKNGGTIYIAGGSTSCYVHIDGNWGDGSSGRHPILRAKAGMRDSREWFSDTDGYRISGNCYATVNTGGRTVQKIAGGKWHKMRDFIHYRFTLRRN